ncbi:MAG: hypothetical protein QOH62_536 [Solirubrobacteraceae bacterium]|jgi:uncharacterized protein (TIGR02271 family)|nr:hypothetical protein [Solirubrobacteraceae bacterium]
MEGHTLNDVETWRGCTVIGPDGEKIGKLDEVYLDRSTGQPEWAAISTGLLGMKVSFAPIEGAVPADGELRLSYDKATVKDAPNVEADGRLSPAEEQRLYAHYGREWGDWDENTPDRTEELLGREERFDRAPEGHDTSGPTTDDAMTRSEEELRVGVERREAGRARLRKYVVTEHVQRTVPVQREEVRIEREPITDANAGQALDGPAISDEEHEVVLHEEKPVVEKTAVPKERVRLATETVTDEETVSEEVRKERIETEGDTGRK